MWSSTDSGAAQPIRIGPIFVGRRCLANIWVGAAEALAFDDLAGDAVSLQVGDRFLNRAAAADPQFHQYWWSGRIPNVRGIPPTARPT